MMNVYKDSEEKYLNTVVVFGKAADGCLYEDKEYETPCDGEKCMDLYLKGLLRIFTGTTSVVPVAATADGLVTISATESQGTVTLSGTIWGFVEEDS